jgi:DNA-binding MarR family transcriptional regulator
MPEGWVKLHRQTLENEIFRHDLTAWHVFEILLLTANSNGQWSGGSYQLAELAGVNKSTLYKAILRLENAGMISRSANARYTVYSVSGWGKYQQMSKHSGKHQNTEVKSPSGKHSGKRSVNSGETLGNTLIRIKNKNKNILSKDNMAQAQYGKPEINELFEYWQQRTGIPISSQIQANRNACNNLIKKHTQDGVRKLIDGVAQSQGDQFAPRIADFVQLQAKLSQLLLWGKQNITSRKVVKI